MKLKANILLAMKDEIISNGDAHQKFTALSFRTYRYVQLDVTTAG